MTTGRTYASWVEPIAKELRRERAAVVEFGRAAPPDYWDRPSPLAGWTNKDLLAHLAAGTNKQFQAILHAVTSNTRLNPAVFGDDGELNGRDIQERRDRSVEALIEEHEADTAEMFDLLPSLKEEDRDRRQRDFDLSLGEWLAVYPGHEHDHLNELRAALEATT